MTVERETYPGIIPYLPEEADDFETSVTRFRTGRLSESDFQVYRLRRGVYGQRQAERQMVRIKIPLGCLSADQLDILGRVVDRCAPLRKGHFTTRENLQLHHVLLDGASDLMRLLGTVGLTTREACGNTVRNVVGCPLAGVCPDELFDATPYGAAFARYFVRRDFTQNMPRKFKTAFTGCREDHAITRMHDMGFAGLVETTNGRAVRGFRIVVGGGTSIEPLLAKELYPFVTADDGAYLRVAEAALRVFNRSDDLRRNRMRARIKVLVNRIGIDAFRDLVEQELKEPWAREPIDLASLLDAVSGVEDGPALPPGPAAPPNGELPYRRWLETNAEPQKQPGYYAARITLPLGDLKADQFSPVADVARRYGNGGLRVTQDQNLVIRWVPGVALHDVWAALEALGLGESGAGRVTDVVSCPGTDSCKLGITASMGLGAAVREMLLNSPDLTADPLISRLHIRMSGCPNGCGQHHIADIGFHGAAVKGDQGRQVPAYEVFLGGRYEGGDVRYAARVKVKVPAKAVPGMVQVVLTLYKERRQDHEAFSAFVDRLGRMPFEEIAARFGGVPSLDEGAGFYVDWARTEPYKVERGEGECAV